MPMKQFVQAADFISAIEIMGTRSTGLCQALKQYLENVSLLL